MALPGLVKSAAYCYATRLARSTPVKSPDLSSGVRGHELAARRAAVGRTANDLNV